MGREEAASLRAIPTTSNETATPKITPERPSTFGRVNKAKALDHCTVKAFQQGARLSDLPTP